jgi:acyl-CoA thioesterase I
MSHAFGEREVIRYVAIGDSYSIGEGATPAQSWPALLTSRLKSEGVEIALIANPSVTGWTTQEAIERELPVFRDAKPTFATLLIGVNDWTQGVSAEKFRTNLTYLLEQMLSILPSRRRLLVVTIPDFSVTPDGPNYARGRDISAGLSSFNKILADECTRRSLAIVDIYPLSQKMRGDSSRVANDGLHPSAKTYAEWEKAIFPAAAELLKK